MQPLCPRESESNGDGTCAILFQRGNIRDADKELLIRRKRNTVIPWYLRASELTKLCNPSILRRKKCFRARHLLGTHCTCENLCESGCCPSRENASSFGTRRFLGTRHEVQNELTVSIEVPLY